MRSPFENRVGLVTDMHPDTSRAAADAITPKSGTQRGRVLELLSRRSLTREEVAAALGIPDNSARPRIRELVAGGWVAPTGDTRPSAAGHESEVMAATMRGRAWVLAERTNAAP